MNKLTVTLKQHTPLIHFQHDQEGATLRASEVKPKLDKFILTKLGEGDYQQGINTAKENKWLVGKGEHPALNYKMRIERTGYIDTVHLKVSSTYNKKKQCNIFTTKAIEKEEFPFLLANMGGKESEDELIDLSLSNNVTLTFNIISGEIKTQILQNIEQFFALNNFGQRQTKGFGSFSVIEIQDNEKKFPKTWNASAYLPDGTPLMEFSIDKNESMFFQFTLFKVLDFYWKCLKSGVNYTKRIVSNNNIIIKNRERYIKPYLYIYLNNHKLTWEKRKIKNSFSLETTLPQRNIETNMNEVIFGRAMLGCPDKFEYRIPTGQTKWNDKKHKDVEIIKEKLVTIENKKVSSKQDLIDRIASPIMFKPIINEHKVRIYILTNKEILKVLNEKHHEELVFTFKCKDQSLDIPLKPHAIDHLDLIRKYHYYLGTNADVIGALYGYEDNNRKWIAGKITDDKKWTFLARDYHWDNILGQTRGIENLIHFKQVKKIIK